MTVYMSEEQARKAGLITSKRKTRTSRAAPDRSGLRSRCSCGEEFTTEAAASRHVEVGHATFTTVLE